MTEPRDYKPTLNLPKTSFPMKANLAQAEPATLARWQANDVVGAVTQARAASEPFVFHDGPPYANGSIHVGHLLNKVLKDIVVRSVLMEGRACHYVPGWDCHGLPIEHRVMTGLVESGKAAKLDTLSDDHRRMAIRRECAAYATKFIKSQAIQMQRLLTLADYANPYFTMQPQYEAGTLEVFADLLEQGFVFRQLKPVHWSIANQTALAEAELEYEDRVDPSIYVDFEAADRAKVDAVFKTECACNPSFMIWTTTPWTLPANLAIALHPTAQYALVEMDGSLTIVAAEMLERVAAIVGATTVTTLATARGSDLVGLEYRHPFCDRTGRIVAADYVTMDDGTGLVHTAPGHGDDDYRTGLREGLDVYCPVQGDGTFDATAPAWLRGKVVWDANTLVVEHLRASGHLVHALQFTHSYPHDWRSRTPVIFRATEQWFIGVDRRGVRAGQSLRTMAMDAVNNSIKFVPQWGYSRMKGMIENRPDWCISRQRAWGLPIPAFRTPNDGVFMTAASVRAVAACVRDKGSDAWFTLSPAELLGSYDAGSDPDAPQDLDISALSKMYDIFDVWFEAGSSWNSVLRQRGIGFPADLYLEGSDQHRGWFQLSMLPALGVTGVNPFRTLLTHGFLVDKDGRKMSKSAGNALDVDVILKDFGAEVARWWVSGVAYDGDIRIDLDYFKVAGESYRKVRNTLRFLLSNLYDAPPWTQEEALAIARAAKPESIDGWLLGELSLLELECRAAYKAYDFRRVHLGIFNFCNESLSSIYCAAVKDRLYCDAADSPRRRQTQATARTAMEVLCRLLAPFLPHTAEEAWTALRGSDAPLLFSQVHLGIAATRDARWDEVMIARSAVSKALEGAKSLGIENPLDAAITLPDPIGALAPFAAELADLCGVSRVALDAEASTVTVADLRSQPRCDRSWRRDSTVRQRSDGGMLSDRDALSVGVLPKLS
ncbi:MAG: isoleucine--tRNA ligase [Phycisphaerales bacterium]|nr:isoleucine--tRNA ligase [Phycisphaerales bacterium]